MAKRCSLILVLILSMTPMLSAEELSFGFMELKPIFYYNQEGKIVGSFVDKVLTRINKQADFKVRYFILPPKRFYLSLHNNEFDFTTLVYEPSVYPNVIFGKVPIDYSEVGLYSLQPIENFRGLAELPDARIGLRRGFTYTGVRKELDSLGDKFTLTKLNRSENIFKMLTSKRVDYVVEYVFADNPLSRYPYQTLRSQYSYITVSKNHPNGQQLVQRLDAVLLKILEQENINTIYD